MTTEVFPEAKPAELVNCSSVLMLQVYLRPLKVAKDGWASQFILHVTNRMSEFKFLSFPQVQKSLHYCTTAYDGN